MHVAIEREDQRERVLGDGIRRIRGNSYHGDTQSTRRVQVDVVVPGAAHGEASGPAACERVEDRFGQVVVDECADRGHTGGQLGGGGVEPGVEESDVVS